MAPMAAVKLDKIINFEGLLAAPFTPLKPNGELNSELIPKYVDYLLSQGVKGAFVNGTTGEGLSLTLEERKTTAEAWVRSSKNRLLILLHISANCVQDARELAAHAEKIGADGISVLPPLFYKPQNHEQLISYLKEVSDAAPTTPLVYYHFPGFSCVELTLSEFLPKARRAIPTLVGAKYTSTEARDILKCYTLPGKPFKVFPGLEEVLLPFLTCGATAAVGAVYTFQAPLTIKIVELFKKGDIAGARKMQSKVMETIDIITTHGEGIAYFKAAANILGPLDFGPPRLPLCELPADHRATLEEELGKLDKSDWTVAY